MNVLTPRVLRTLRFVDGLERVGYAPTKDEVDSFAAAPDPVESQGVVLDFLWDYLEQVQNSVEPASSHMSRLRWVEVDEGRISLTSLGRAVLLAQQEGPALGDDLIEAAVDPSDTFAYARLLGRLSALEDTLMIDPYIDQQQLIELAQLPRLRRVLTSLPGRNTTDKEARRVRLSMVMSKVNRPLELRIAPAGVLHDRIMIPEMGGVVQLSSSLNSITERVSIVTTLGADLSASLRQHYDEIWRDADTILAPTENDPSGTGR